MVLAMEKCKRQQQNIKGIFQIEDISTVKILLLYTETFKKQVKLTFSILSRPMNNACTAENDMRCIDPDPSISKCRVSRRPGSTCNHIQMCFNKMRYIHIT
jgi:hypothetical protein